MSSQGGHRDAARPAALLTYLLTYLLTHLPRVGIVTRHDLQHGREKALLYLLESRMESNVIREGTAEPYFEAADGTLHPVPPLSRTASASTPRGESSTRTGTGTGEGEGEGDAEAGAETRESE